MYKGKQTRKGTYVAISADTDKSVDVEIYEDDQYVNVITNGRIVVITPTGVSLYDETETLIYTMGI